MGGAVSPHHDVLGIVEVKGTIEVAPIRVLSIIKLNTVEMSSFPKLNKNNVISVKILYSFLWLW